MGSHHNRYLRLLAVAAWTTLVLACAPQRSGVEVGSAIVQSDRLPASIGSGSAGYTEARGAQGAGEIQEKTLVIGIAAEVKAFSTLNGQQNKYVEDLVHGNLFIQEEGGRWIPALAAEIPSLENGTWKLNPDGTSETIYKLRPGVKWHDGVEFTVQDLLFSWQVGKDPELPFESRDRWEAIRGMDALDDYTVRVTWKTWDPEADTLDHRILWPMPRHILEPAYSRDKLELLGHPFWSTEFVGLGPYKLVKFEPGSHLQLTANEDYILGSPRIRNLIVRFYGDSNVLISALLAGDVHMTLHGNRSEGGLTMGDGIVLGSQWSGNAEGKVLFNPYRIAILSVQWQRDFQQPASLADPRVRQALLHGMDRQAIVDQLYRGFTQVADAWIPPRDPDYPSFEEAVTRYDFDPARALALLAEAGWQRGADGVLVNSRGERFGLEYRTQGREEESVATAVADNWKQVGIDTQLLPIPSARTRDQEWMAKFSGVRTHTMVSSPVGGATGRYTCTRVPGPDNNWLNQSSNPGGYCSPEMEARWKQLDEAFPFAARMEPFKEMMRVALKDLPYLPLYFDSEAVAVRSNVIGLNRVPPKTRGRVGMLVQTWTLE